MIVKCKIAALSVACIALAIGSTRPAAAGIAQAGLGQNSDKLLEAMSNAASKGEGAGVSSALSSLAPVTAQISASLGLDMAAEGAGVGSLGADALTQFSQRYIAASALSALYSAAEMDPSDAKIAVKTAYRELGVLFSLPSSLRKPFAVMTSVAGKNPDLYLKQVEVVRKTLAVKFKHCDIASPVK